MHHSTLYLYTVLMSRTYYQIKQIFVNVNYTVYSFETFIIANFPKAIFVLKPNKFKV